MSRQKGQRVSHKHTYGFRRHLRYFSLFAYKLSQRQAGQQLPTLATRYLFATQVLDAVNVRPQ